MSLLVHQRLAIASRLMESAMFDGPPKMLSAIWSWVEPKVWGHVLALTLDRLKELIPLSSDDRSIDPKIVELKLLQKDAQKHTSRAKFLRGTVRMEFDVDLDGWRYLREFDDPWDVLEEVGDTIKVVVSFKDQMTSAGSWTASPDDDHLGTLDIQAFAPLYQPLKLLKEQVLGSRQAVRAALDHLHDTLRHELEHLGQDLLDEMRNVAAGSISPKYRGSSPDETNQDLHPLEFYPRLRDDVNIFERHLRKVPRSRWRSELDKWSKTTNTYLGTLFHLDRKMWRKGLTEFVKELTKKGIQI